MYKQRRLIIMLWRPLNFACTYVLSIDTLRWPGYLEGGRISRKEDKDP
jgi:hypothetical protein